MMNDLPSNREWVIGLYAYPKSPPDGMVFVRYLSSLSRLLDQMGLAITHIAAEGGDFSGKLVTPGSAEGKRITASRLNDIAVLSCVVCPTFAKTPAFDRVVSASLSWNSPGELLLCVAVNESVTFFNSNMFQAVLSELIRLESWSFGYAFCDTAARQPEFHVLSLDSGTLNAAEAMALRKWYASRISDRMLKLRSIYPITIANEAQIACKVNGGSLGDFMRSSPGTGFERIGNLYLWRVPEAQVSQLRDRLQAAGVLVAHS